MDPSVKRLAVEVDDHDLEYAGFEGIVGERQYGPGLVLVWDAGWFEPANLSVTQETAEDMVKVGKLDFTLHGERLRGSFSLILTKGNSGQCLFIKWRDAEALSGVDIIEKYQTSVLTGRSLKDMEQEAKKGTLKTHHCV
jgi:bifunctional non-homologous end joining protein LigD